MDQGLSEREKRISSEQALVVADLQAAGVNVRQITAVLRASPDIRARAVPILLEHLQRPYSSVTRALIANALAVREAMKAWPLFVQLYLREQDGFDVNGFRLPAKGGLANAIAATTTKDRIPELIALARDPANGSSRVLFLHRLRRSKVAAAHDALQELAKDPELAKEISSWRKRAKGH